jgi:hypothetical protein
MDDNTRRLTIFIVTAFCTVLIVGASMIWAVGYHRHIVSPNIHPVVAAEAPSPNTQLISANHDL